MEEKKTVRVVGAAVVDGGRVLVAQRKVSDSAYKSLKWEFPGGKIEDGESVEEAVCREIREELDCEICVDALLPEIEYEYPDFIIRMVVCICHLLPGSEIRCLEHNAIRWTQPSGLSEIDWAAADRLALPFLLGSGYLNS